MKPSAQSYEEQVGLGTLGRNWPGIFGGEGPWEIFGKEGLWGVFVGGVLWGVFGGGGLWGVFGRGGLWGVQTKCL